MSEDLEILSNEAVSLLQQLIATPSFSKEEDKTAGIINEHLEQNGITPYPVANNVWAKNKYFDGSKPAVLLNSHHDTVKPSTGYTRDPFAAAIENDKLYGLGSNDAGGALVSLISAFKFFYAKENLKYNLLLACTAEEEISGSGGISLLLPHLPKIEMGIVGEPTSLQMAIAEKGLMVLDCKAKGKSGHAARDEGDNAIYKAIQDIEWFRSFKFPKESKLLGPVKMTATIINAGKQHNVIPDECTFTVDVRTTDAYTNEEVLNIVCKNVSSEVAARSVRLQPSSIAGDHPLVVAGKKTGLKTFGSPTLSDQALMNFPTVKLGPGDSARSHIANEFIYLSEIREGIKVYISLLNEILNSEF